MSLSGQIWTVSFFCLSGDMKRIFFKVHYIWGHERAGYGEGGRIEILDAGSQSQAVITVPLITKSEVWQSIRSRFGGSASYLDITTLRRS